MSALEQVVRTVADRERLAVLGVLAAGDAGIGDVVERCGLPRQRAVRLLGKLVADGFAAVDDGVYRMRTELLREAVELLPRAEPIRPHLLAGLDAEDAAVVSRFFAGGRLTEIPASEGKRLAVLRVLIDEFEPGRYYPESEVRRILRKFHPDDAALRRCMVEAELLARENARRIYWRSPGPPPGPVRR